MTVPEPIEHSVVGVPNEGGNSSVDLVTVPEPIEHSVVAVPNEVGNSYVDIVTVPDPIEHFRVMPFGLCNAPATFERLMDRVLCGMWWSRCLVYLYDVISFGTSIPEALARLEEVLSRLSDFGLQLKAKKCTFMQTEVAFWDILWAGLGWHATRKRSQLSGTGMRRTKLKQYASLWVLWDIIADLLRISRGWRSLWWH